MALILILAAVAIVAVVLYNSLIGARNRVDESLAAIDATLQNRADLIPNLVETVKRYAGHEADTLAAVTEKRASAVGAGAHDATAGRFSRENELSSTLRSIFAVAENYPDLKASTNFLDLQNQWTEIEDRLQGARRAYNAAVTDLRDKRRMFPSNIVAGMMTLPDYALYEAEDAAREAPDARELFAR